MGRRDLVIVRAGSNSLHRDWLAGAAERSWDLIVGYYDRDAYERRPIDAPGIRHVFCPGGKWEGIAALFEDAELLARYEYFWLPDDDIETRASAINTIFRVARNRHLAVCQPALTGDSYFSFFLLTACPDFRLRYTNFVEIMVPCLRRDVLAQVLPRFAATKSGFGLDYLWHRLSEENWGFAAVIDEIQVRHTRPVSSRAVRHALNGRSSDLELREAIGPFGLPARHRPVAYAGITTDGRLINGEVNVGLRMTAAHLKRWRDLLPVTARRKALWRLLRTQLKVRAELSQLSVGAV